VSILSGINPVLESLKAGHPLDRILVAKGAGGPRLQQIVDLARRASVPVRFEERAGLDRLAGSPAHQGVVAMGASKRYAELEDVAPAAQLLVILDGVEDPHNLGAIVRTAHAAGAGGIVIPERRAVGLTDVVAKAAAGALEYLPVVRAVNINRTLDELKELGYWIYGLDERGTEDGAGFRRRGQRLARAGAQALRRDGAHSDGGAHSLVERVGGRRHRVVRAQTASRAQLIVES